MLERRWRGADYWRLRSSFLSFLASFFSFGVLDGSFFTDFFVSLLLLMVAAPFFAERGWRSTAMNAT